MSKGYGYGQGKGCDNDNDYDGGYGAAWSRKTGIPSIAVTMDVARKPSLPCPLHGGTQGFVKYGTTMVDVMLC